MADDWARKYAEEYDRKLQEKRQKEQEAQVRRGHAQAGAREKFHEIRERVKQDVRILHTSVALQAIDFLEYPEGKFEVIHPSAPRTELHIDLKDTRIVCEYVFFPREGAQETRPQQESKTLRICSDLDGRLAVYKNGSEEALTDITFISEFILKPLLSHICQ